MAEAYTVLARRYRSQNFDELVGQEAIAQTLKNAITANRVAHAFLFTGTRGVGKTSSARILAKAINCPNSEGGQPCGTCETCKAIARGEDMDVIEIDGASNNGVDQVRELRQNAGIRPARSPYKIYIIDEVHMLSTGAFNALLKTLEEPPEHVKFIFATTDVHKVPATIISRCQRFDFKNIPTGKIAAHLKVICKDEGMQADAEALHRIARLGNGSMRDALSLLDRVLSLGEKHITEKLLEELLGKPATSALAELVEAIANGDAGAALKRSDGLLREGMGAEQVLGELVEFLRNVMLVAVCGKDTDILDVPADVRPVFTGLAEKFDGPTLVHLIALCEQTLRSLKSTTMARPLFDALIVRLAMSEQFSSIKEIIEHVGNGQGGGMGAGVAQKKNDGGSGVREGAGMRVAVEEAPVLEERGVTAAGVVPMVEEGEGEAWGDAAVPVSGRAAADAAGAAKMTMYQELKAKLLRETPPAVAPQVGRPGVGGRPRAVASTAVPQVVMPTTVPVGPVAVWTAVRDYFVQTKTGSMNTMMDSASLLSCDVEAGEAALQMAGHLRGWLTEKPRAKIEEALKAVLGRGVKLSVVFTEEAAGGGAGAGGRPMGVAASAAAVQRVPPEVMEAVRNTAVVQQVLERLGGDVTSVEILEAADE